ncbi:hypothetical protein NSK_007163 [Nannochloropsis salina CCMP1776]|uniref:Uncharacterized protein n=1 Tax=Nannochloropsis salina CCMP1776 TaxID=1027361 RepID=A0A4D9CQQ0_9STRA|nr:hypothetical protein NSK_007163 [Nannochloropsis salina CCMP1776]|eukprot:TFJ81492.1 hypothetical protein NSK_007163 [Nannochloropsis salina CCMP1776]
MAKITVTLRSKDPVDNVEFQVNLPDRLSVERTAMRPSSKSYTPPQIVEDADGVTAISWQGVAFTKRKGGKRRFRVKVKADQCAPETLAVYAFAYLMNATDTSCMTPLANPAIVKVRYLKGNKDATCAPTPAPTVNPTQPFVLFGEGLRFSQGERLAPFEDRRLSLHTGINRHEGIIALYHPEDRLLQSINTPEACYEYCSLNGGEEVPFLFSWNTVTSQCFCCAGVASNGSPNTDTYSIAYSRTHSYPYPSTLTDSNGSPNFDTYSIAYSRTDSYPYPSTLTDSNGSPNFDTYSIAYSRTDSYPYPSTFNDSNGLPNFDTYSIAYSRTDSYPYPSTFNDSNGSPNADTYSIAYSRTLSYPYPSTFNDSNGSPNADTYSIAYSRTDSYPYPSTFNDSYGSPQRPISVLWTALHLTLVKINYTLRL